MSRRIWIPRGLVSSSRATGVNKSPSRTLEGGPRVLELYQERGPTVIQEFCGTIPGNSQLGVVGSTNSLKGGRGGPGGLVLQQTRAEGGPRGLVLHQGGWDRSDPRGGNWIPGNSRLYSSV